MIDVCKNLNNYIQRNKINREELAEKLDFDSSIFFKQLRGEYQLDVGSMLEICNKLNVTPAIFYE